MVHNYLTRIIIAGLSILMTSCYSDYVYLGLNTHHDPDPVFNYQDSSKIAFVSTQEAYLRVKGISAFPDGGQPKIIYNKTGLYIIDVKSNNTTHLMELSETPPYLYTNTKLLYIDDFICYNCEIDTSKSIDSTLFLSLKNKYVKCFSINIKTKEISIINTAEFNSLDQKNNLKCSLSELNKKLNKIPLAEFGMVIQDIYPKSDEAYIKELIYAKSGGKVSNRAIIEQIISRLNKQEIKSLLKEMNDYKNSLDGWDEVYEKAKYEYYLEETSKSIQKLL
jgi:hypothetical protein